MAKKVKTLEKRELSRQQLTAINHGGSPTQTGLSISEENSLTLPAVYSAIDRYTTIIAGLDFKVYRQIGKDHQEFSSHPVARLMRRPNKYMDKNKFMRTIVLSLMVSGNSYVEIEYNNRNIPIALHPISFRNVTVKQNPNLTLSYVLRRENAILDQSRVLHFTGLSWNGLSGISPVEMARQSLSIGMAAERLSASTYANGGVQRGHYTTDKQLSPATYDRFVAQMAQNYGGIDNAGKSPILEEGLHYVPNQFTPEDMLLIGSREFTILDVCRVWQIPPGLLFVGQNSYNVNEENYRQWIQTTVRNLLESMEDQLEFKLLEDAELDSVCFEYDLDGMLRGDPKARTETNKTLWMMGALTSNEARIIEGYNPLEGGDKRYIPANMMDADESRPTNVSHTSVTDPIGGSPGPLDGVLEPARAMAEQILAREARRGLTGLQKRASKGDLSPEWLASYFEDFEAHCREVLPAVEGYLGRAVTDTLVAAIKQGNVDEQAMVASIMGGE